MELTCDVVVAGAGASGLCAARVLSQHGVGTVLLEARGRVGGRLLTREDPHLPVPVDLGGEFVHGSSAASFALLRAAGTVAVDTGETSFAFEDGELREREDPFDLVTRVMSGARALPHDVSIESFLRGLPGSDAETERGRRYTRMLVEGFDAADPRLASTRALVHEWGDDANGQTSQQFRPLGGYARVMRAAAAALDPAHVAVRLGSPVRAVSRGAEGVRVDADTAFGEPLTVRARAAIVTLPVGVLRAGHVAFEPALPERTRDALAHLVMGPVVKLALRFRTAFWERVHGARFRDGAFFHRAEASFPTFWTMTPLRAPLLIAWAGGPKAGALAGRAESELIDVALDDLRALFGDEADARVELEAAYAHDWQSDPYALGAYSFVTVGGEDARARFAEPVDGVLFFAGEASAPASTAGTVAGAVESGERAAHAVLAALGR